MTEHLCGCGRPSRDATICAACGYALDAALADITAYRGLAWDLDIAVAKQARFTAKDALVRITTPKLPYAEGASLAARELHNTLATWARLIIEETGATYPADGIAATATWLRPWVGWLRQHPAGQEAHDEIIQAVGDAWRVCDRPPGRLYAGPCEGEACDGHLYARVGAPAVICAGCGEANDVETRRTWLLAALDDHLANSKQMARLVGYLGITVPDSTIRWWAMKGRFLAHGEDQAGHPLYRLGDVVRTYAKASSKAS